MFDVPTWLLRRLGPFLLIALVIASLPALAHAQDRGRARWEYLDLTSYDSANDENDLIRVGTPVEVMEFRSFAALCRKLTPEPKRSDFAYVLNLLGADGWELVSHTASESTRGVGTTQRWTFKRLVLGR